MKQQPYKRECLLDDQAYFDGYTETSISGGTTTTTKFYAASGQTIAMNMSNAIYYLLADFLNSSNVVLNSDGTLKAAQRLALLYGHPAKVPLPTSDSLFVVAFFFLYSLPPPL